VPKKVELPDEAQQLIARLRAIDPADRHAAHHTFDVLMALARAKLSDADHLAVRKEANRVKRDVNARLKKAKQKR